MSKEYWSTKNEIRFLNRIGQWAGLRIKKSDILRNYEKSIILRKNWGKIDKKVIENYLKSIHP